MLDEEGQQIRPGLITAIFKRAQKVAESKEDKLTHEEVELLSIASTLIVQSYNAQMGDELTEKLKRFMTKAGHDIDKLLD